MAVEFWIWFYETTKWRALFFSKRFDSILILWNLYYEQKNFAAFQIFSEHNLSQPVILNENEEKRVQEVKSRSKGVSNFSALSNENGHFHPVFSPHIPERMGRMAS